MPTEQWETLFDVAVDQHGFVTSRDAARLGLRPSYLGELRADGSIEKVAYGLYRFPQVPVTEHTHLMEAVLWVGEGAALSHDAVLSMHGLANANPSTTRVTTPRRVRRSDPPSSITIIRRELPPEDLTVYDGIPSTTVARALRDSRGIVMQSRLIEAAHDARDEGLVRRRELSSLLADLERSDG